MAIEKSGQPNPTQQLNQMHSDANRLFYDIDGQINNLYNMHARQRSGSHHVNEMKESDIQVIRERINLLKDKVLQLQSLYQSPDTTAALSPEKQTYWRERIEHINRNANSLPGNLDRAQRNYQRNRSESTAYPRSRQGAVSSTEDQIKPAA